jgi:hypothetical protein
VGQRLAVNSFTVVNILSTAKMLIEVKRHSSQLGEPLQAISEYRW